MSDENAVLLAIGRLQASLDHMQRDFAAEKISATQSRRALYERHDGLQEQIGSLRMDLQAAGQTTLQAREEARSAIEKVEQHRAEIKSSVEDWKKIKTLGMGITGVLAIGGLSAGALLSMGWDALKAATRSWLG